MRPGATLLEGAGSAEGLAVIAILDGIGIECRVCGHTTAVPAEGPTPEIQHHEGCPKRKAAS